MMDAIEPWCAALSRPGEDWPAIERALAEIEGWSATASDPRAVERVLSGVIGVAKVPGEALEAELHAATLRAPAWRCLDALHGALARIYGASP